MFDRITFVPHQSGSAGLRNLRGNLTTLNLVSARPSRPRVFSNNSRRLLINWGTHAFTASEYGRNTVLNPGEILSMQSNKKRFFAWAEDVGLPIPDWTDDRNVAEQWQRDGFVVVARALVSGHSGNGIVIVNPEEELPQVRLFTRYMPKMAEFRVHFFRGSVIDIQKKGIMRGSRPSDWQVRTHRNGFVYIREGFGPVPLSVSSAANQYIDATPLDFGALDIIWNQRHDTATILEVNTAPGLMGETARRYARVIDQFCTTP